MPSWKAVMSMLMMSPSSSTVSSGMPWQITSLSEVHDRLRVAAVAERRRVGAVLDEEVVGDRVEFVGGDARSDGGADRLDGLGRDPPAGADPLDLGGRVDVGAGERTRSGPADVLGPGDRSAGTAARARCLPATR